MKNVLFVTTYYPPTVGPASQRHRKLAKYLPTFGWNPIVLSIEDSVMNKDLARMDNLSNIEVNRVSLSWPLRWFFRRRDVNLLANKLLVPDEGLVWLSAFKKKVRELLAQRSYDAIYTSCGPFGLALLGRWAKEQYGLPWVIDYRDGWTLGAGFRPISPWHEKKCRRLETNLLSECDYYIANTEGLLNAQCLCWPFLQEKSSCVTNGVDPEDYVGLSTPSPETGRTLRFVYSGTWYRKLYPPTLFRILAAFKKLEPRVRWELHYSGPHAHFFLEMAKSFNLDKVTIDHGHLSYRETLELMSEADVLLLALPSDKRACFWVPAKLYEYLAVGRPVFGVIPEGDASRLLEQGGVAVSPDPQKVGEGVKVMRQWFRDDRLKQNSRGNDSIFQKYGYSTLAKKLASALDQALLGRRKTSLR